MFIVRVIENLPTLQELTNEINEILSDERQGIMEPAIRILEECPSCKIKSLLRTISKTPSEQREEVIKMTLSHLINKECIKQPDILTNIISNIPSDEREKVLQMAKSIFSRPLSNDEVLDRIRETVRQITEIPCSEREEVLQLAEDLIKEKCISDDMERSYIIDEIKKIPSHERKEVMKLAKPLLDSQHFRSSLAQTYMNIL